MSIDKNSNKQLPLFIDKTILPTGKYHISYSELFDWMECSFRHKLKYIDKLDVFTETIHTMFGTSLHDALEAYSLTSKMPDYEEIINGFKQKIGTLFFTEKAVTKEDCEEFINSIIPILEQVPIFLDQSFPGWKVVSAEQQLFEPIKGFKNKYFKGFIDVVIKVPKTKEGKVTRLSGIKGETIQGEWVYYILDWKGTAFGWKAAQKKSFEKQMQLILYKHFLCEKLSINTADVKCGFCFLRRKPNKQGERIEILPVSAGPKATDKALNCLYSALNQIQSGRYIKNKMSCLWCRFSGTRHCP